MALLSNNKRIEALNALINGCKFYMVELTDNDNTVRTVYATTSIDELTKEIAESIEVDPLEVALEVADNGKYSKKDFFGGSTLIEEVDVQFSLL